MKTLKKFIGTAVFLLTASLVYAHGDHHDDEQPATKITVAARGDMIMGALIAEKKLASSWQQKKMKEVAFKVTPAGSRWVISYTNPDEKDKSKQTIYILLDEVGNYLGANHTGKY